MNDLIEIIRDYVKRREPETLAALDLALSEASEVVIIGSAAMDCFTYDSDLDIFLVGERKRRVRTRVLELIWVTPKDLESRRWLGSELASHVARYGKWARGDGAWRCNVVCSQMAVQHKCSRVFSRFLKIYLKRHLIDAKDRDELLVKCFLDIQRAVLLAKGDPVPSSLQVMELFLAQTAETLSTACSDELLGRLGEVLAYEFSDLTRVERLIEEHANDKRSRIISPWWAAS